MRVLLTPGRRDADERGATAILVAVLSTVLLGVSAFAVDFGMAYASKRQLQTAVDAASLAAASVYASHPGSCDDLAAETHPARATAQSTADAVLLENHPAGVTAPITVTCGPHGGLVVGYASTATTPVGLGAVYGGDDITTSREAEATLGVAQTATDLRPYAVCSDALPSGPLPSGVTKVTFPGGSHNGCPNAPGNRWQLDCPVDGGNGNKTLVEATLDGCEGSIEVVPDQPAPGSVTPEQLSDFLVSECPQQSVSCLVANPGNDFNKHVADAWGHILGERVVLPVFCGDVDCEPTAVHGVGNNTIYPVYKFVAATVCGYHWKNQTNQVHTGACADNPLALDAGTGGNNDNYLLLSFTRVQTSGSTALSSCALASSCDGGMRQAWLTR